jgi:regulator of protease activity HflC (stomatin/prohibitin superfamily)
MKKLSQILLLGLLAGALPMLEGCIGCTHVEMGEVGIKIDNCANGAQPELVGTGYHMTGACTTIKEYPTTVQTAVWTHNPAEGHPQNEEITFTNADQMQIAVDISLAYQLDPSKVPAFYAKFRADDLDSYTHGFLRNLAREKFDTAGGKYRIDQVMGDNAEFLKEVRAGLQADVAQYGISIVQFGFIGAPRPPQAVINSINAKATATQKALQIELELKQAEAEGRKRVAQAEAEAQATKATAEGEAYATKLHAEAEAYANQKLASSLSGILVEYLKATKWDGHLPQVSGGTTPLINLGSK